MGSSVVVDKSSSGKATKTLPSLRAALCSSCFGTKLHARSWELGGEPLQMLTGRETCFRYDFCQLETSRLLLTLPLVFWFSLSAPTLLPLLLLQLVLLLCCWCCLVLMLLAVGPCFCCCLLCYGLTDMFIELQAPSFSCSCYPTYSTDTFFARRLYLIFLKSYCRFYPVNANADSARKRILLLVTAAEGLLQRP